MKVTISKQDGEAVVLLNGRLDTPASLEVADKLEPLKAFDEKTLILDCKDLSYISSSGLRIFLALRKAAAEKGGRVIVRDINDSIRTIFMMTGFLNFFEIQ